MASDLISVSARYALLGPQASKDKETKPSYVVTLSLCAKEALDFEKPKAVVHMWPRSSLKSQDALTDLGQVLPFSSTFLQVPSFLATLSPTMVLREIGGVMASLAEGYPSPASPRILVYPMTQTTFYTLDAQVSSLLTSFPSCMILVYLCDAEPEASWSYLLPTLCFSPPSGLTSFDRWLDACGISTDYHVPTTRFGRDLVLETTGDQEVNNLTLYTSNVASFSQHAYSCTRLSEPTLLPSLGEEGVMRHLYHNGPSGIITSKDHLVLTWTCSSLPSTLSLDGRTISPEAVQVSPFAILEDGLERTPPESTSIRSHSDYFFALALWRHGSSHLKALVMHHSENSSLFSSRIVSDLTTELLRFSSKHQENSALATLIQETVSRARACLKGPSTLSTIHEADEDCDSKSESLGAYVMGFLTMADQWYQRYLIGSSSSSAEPYQRKWAAFWEEAIPLVQGVRSLAKLTSSPAFPPATSRPGLERQFSCMEPPPPLDHTFMGSFPPL